MFLCWDIRWLLLFLFQRFTAGEECDSRYAINLFKNPYTCFYNSSAMVGWLNVTHDIFTWKNEPESYKSLRLIRIEAYKQRTVQKNQWADYYEVFYDHPESPSDLKMCIGELGKMSVCLTATKLTHFKLQAGPFLGLFLPIFGNDPVVWDVLAEINGALFHQKLRFLPFVSSYCRKDSIADCPTTRFVYADCSSEEEVDIAYIAPDKSPSRSYSKYHLIIKGNSSVDQKIVATFTDTENISIWVPSSGCLTFYEVTSHLNYVPYILIGGSIIIIVLIMAMGGIFFVSRVKLKTVALIYCRCEDHVVYSRIIGLFEQLLEDSCSMQVKRYLPDERSVEKDNLLRYNVEDIDYIIYVPFPTIADHHAYNAEIEEQINKSSSVSKKIELQMPWYKADFPTKFWSEGEYKAFTLMQDFHHFINYIHPYFYPRHFEKVLRPNLHTTSLAQRLDEFMFGNSYIEALTDQAATLCPINSPKNAFTAVANIPKITINDQCFL